MANITLTRSAEINYTARAGDTVAFTNPIVVNPGEFIAVVKKKVGTAPSAGVIAHYIGFDHVFID